MRVRRETERERERESVCVCVRVYSMERENLRLGLILSVLLRGQVVAYPPSGMDEAGRKTAFGFSTLEEQRNLLTTVLANKAQV